MPLLTRGRSAVDLASLNIKTGDDQTQPRPKTSTTLSPNDRPPSPRPVSEFAVYARSRLSHEVRRDDVPDDPKTSQDDAGGRAKRFSLLKLRNFSESHLSVKVKEDGKAVNRISQQPPPLPAMPPTPPAVPAIVKTAPTMDNGGAQLEEEETEEERERERKPRQSFFRRSMSKGRSPDRRGQMPRKSMDEKRGEKKASSLRWRRLQGRSTGLEDLQRLANANIAQNQVAPPSYGDESNSALALPVTDPRFSESSRSDGSNGSSDQIYGSTTTTTHTVSTHTTFFKLPRRNKNRNSLFPLPVKIPPPEQPPQQQQDEPTTPRASTSALSSKSQGATPNGRSPPATILQRRHTETSPTKQQPPLPVNAALAKQNLAFAEPGVNLFRNDSQRSRASSNSSPLQPPRRLGMRDRASTASSLGRSSYDMGTPPPFPGSGRNSTSTQGRSSFGTLLNLSRFRQSSDPHSPRHGSPGTGSKSNSFAMSREALVVPEREEGDTPGKYLERLEAAVARSMIAGILSKSADPFAQAVLRSYMRRFRFFGEPIDMSLRKLLLEAELPRETQQVDRVIQAFADRYHECNPGIFVSPDQAYIIAFSLMMLHTDAFNKNNKRKMQKQDYIKNTSGQSVSDDVLGCFYDNICYTPFVHYEEEVDINGERVLPFSKPKKNNKLKGAIGGGESAKKPSGPVDPYNLLVDQKLEQLRPAIKDSITMDDPYNYRGHGQPDLDPLYLQRAFTHTGVLQIISQRSRPTAYEGQFLPNSEGPTSNPMEMQPGIIDIKITKVGTLWRKATKKKKARSPWQEWGAILTGSQLYLFKNAHWAKGLVHQFTAAQRIGHPRIPVVFKPPLQEFKPDALIKTDYAVALVDATYTRHKHAFTFMGSSGQQEVLLADNESELHDWLALINYAAAFRAAGVRIRGMVGGTEEDLRRGDLRRLESTQSARSVQTVESNLTAGAAVAAATGGGNRGLSPQLQKQVMAARRQIIVQKIGEASKDIAETSKELDNMLRNARHLLVLAPIAPKTREDVIHAAAQADASIKWALRDMWRLKCHRDILALDVQMDGVSAEQLETLAQQQIPEQVPESAKKSKVKGLLRLNSRASETTRSPPQSPQSLTHAAAAAQHRPSTTGSLEMMAANDVFRTPPEAAAAQRQSLGLEIPPFQLEVLRQEGQQLAEERLQRGSVASTYLSTSSQGQASLSHASSTSSVRRLQSDEPSEGSRGRRTPTQDAEVAQVEALARTTISPERIEPIRSHSGAPPGAPANLDGTPDSKHKTGGGVRRSLQKTLRDAQHTASYTSGHHKHKKGKESDSTIRSGGERSYNSKDVREAGKEEEEEGTPGLKREKGRFILHGKQASVVHFGNDWPNERMKARREQWRQNTNGDKTYPGAGPPTGSVNGDRPEMLRRPSLFSSIKDDYRTDAASAVVQILTSEPDAGVESPAEEEDGFSSVPSSSGTGAAQSSQKQQRSLLQDAGAAEAFVLSAEPGRFEASPEVIQGEASSIADATEEQNGDGGERSGKRETVIGPSSSSRLLYYRQKSFHEDDAEAGKGKRTTVIGPSTSSSIRHVVNNEGSRDGSVSAAAEYHHTNGGAEHEDEDDGAESFYDPDDEEGGEVVLRRSSTAE